MEDHAQLTPREIIQNHTIQLFNYDKYDGHPSGNPTGCAVKANECDDLAVIYIDISKHLDELTKKLVQGSILLSSPVDHVDVTTIQPFLDHVHDVIAAGDDEVCDYVLNWFAAILQQPCFKTETALVLISKQGVGKNRFFTDILCKLMSRYAAKNVTNVDHIVGKFNSMLENMKLIVVNELQPAEFNQAMNSDTLKSIITDDTVIINQKIEPMRVIKNVANFILVSNNAVPIKVESDDRRYVVISPSDIHWLDDAYFDKLASSFTPAFYRHLFTFFITRDITNVNLRYIPTTQARVDLINANKPSYELFVDDHWDELVYIYGDDLYQRSGTA